MTRDEHEEPERTSNGKPEIDTAILIRSRPFERATPVFPKPISMRMNLAGRPIVPLHALTEETLRPNVNVDNNSESDTILMSKYATEDTNPPPADFSGKFRSPVFPVSIDTLLSHSSRIENTDTTFDYFTLNDIHWISHDSVGLIRHRTYTIVENCVFKYMVIVVVIFQLVIDCGNQEQIN